MIRAEGQRWGTPDGPISVWEAFLWNGALDLFESHKGDKAGPSSMYCVCFLYRNVTGSSLSAASANFFLYVGPFLHQRAAAARLRPVAALHPKSLEGRAYPDHEPPAARFVL